MIRRPSPIRRWPLAPRLRHAERVMVAGFVLAIGIVSWGGWTLWQSMVRHRATADETLRDHASYISLNYSIIWGNQAWFSFLGPFTAAEAAADDPGFAFAEVVALAARDAYESELPSTAPTAFFAGDAGAWLATAPGGPVDPILAERLDARIADSLPDLGYRGTVVIRGTDTTLAVLRPRSSQPGWVGFEVSLADFREAILVRGPRRTQEFFDRLHDSLPERWPHNGPLVPFSVRLTTADEIPLLAFNPPIPDGWTMTEYALTPFSARVLVTIGPDAVPYLMPGGYPPTPGPRVAAVIVLALLLLGGTAALAWRTLSLSRMREQFTHAVSHELRTPLANIHLYAETLLLERIQDPGARRAALETITRETRRLGDMVENVLATARMARAEETLSPVEDRMGRLVHEVLDAFQPVLASRGIAVEVDLVGDDLATIDPDAVRRILVNLLDNAIRHGPEGQRLRVVADHTGEEVLLIVEDEGPGIPPEDRERVWLPYTRGSSGGSGLGLAVVRHLARLHGGDAVVGDLATGARIEVRLAAHQEAG